MLNALSIEILNQFAGFVFWISHVDEPRWDEGILLGRLTGSMGQASLDPVIGHANEL
jgi:hypothetical protein